MNNKIRFNITLEDLRNLNPCYDPATKLGNGWSGTLLDILNGSRIPDDDKIWAVTKLLDEKTARLFAVHCAKEAIKNIKDKVDERIIKCIEVAEKFANGQASDEERYAAESAARSAARSAAWSAAWSAAESAARSAAWSAAESAAWSAFVTKLKEMVTDLCIPKITCNLADASGSTIPSDLAISVLEYFGSKLKTDKSKDLYDKALELLKQKSTK